jgi:hypothetical protein
MNIELNTNTLIKKNITADEWLWLYLLDKRAYDVLLKYQNISPLENHIDNLVTKRLVHNEPNNLEFDKIIIRSNFTDLLDSKDYFDDIMQEYPVKVIRPDGTTDYLRVDLNRCRKEYAKITKNNRELHIRIVDLLKFEVAQRTRDGKLSYMPRLPKWIDSQGWTAYEQYRNDLNPFIAGNQIESAGYGQGLS